MRILHCDNGYRPKLVSAAPRTPLGKESYFGPGRAHSPGVRPPRRRDLGQARDWAGGAGGRVTRRRLPGLESRSSSSADPPALKPGGRAGPIRSLAIRGVRHCRRTQVSPSRVRTPRRAAREAPNAREALPAPADDISACDWLIFAIGGNGSDA